MSFWLNEVAQYDNNIFVTDEYSVENYVVSAQGFNAWMVHFEGFARAKMKEMEGILSEFNASISRFKEKMMPIMAQAIVAKRHDPSISLSEYKISNNTIQFELIEGHVTFHISDNSKVLSKWKLTEDDNDEIIAQLECFREHAEEYSVRGKWILCFMAELGEFIRLNFQHFVPSFQWRTKLSPTCHVPTAQCFSAIAPHCADKVSKRLSAFLDNTYGQYISSAQ